MTFTTNLTLVDLLLLTLIDIKFSIKPPYISRGVYYKNGLNFFVIKVLMKRKIRV